MIPFPYQETGSDWLAARRTAILAWGMRCGKAQPMSAKVLTPTGWTTMGELRVGTAIVGRDGLTYSVLSVHPQGVKPVYRVTMSDGSSTEACGDHLWNIQSRGMRYKAKMNRRPFNWRTWTLDQIVAHGLKITSHPTHPYNKWFIPMASVVQFADPGPLPMDPYLLGLLLGNGHFACSIRFSSQETELVSAVQSALPIDMGMVRSESRSWDYTLTRGRPTLVGENEIINAINGMGLHQCRAAAKFIPKAFLTASPEQRIAVMQGLLDTDGSVAPNTPTIEYTTASPMLMDGMEFIVQSIGGILRRGQDKIVDGKTYHRASIFLDFNPFRLTRKRDLYKAPNLAFKRPCRSIDSVELVGEKECQCISVSAPDGLYITDNFIVTHNTGTSLRAAQKKNPDAPILVVGPSVCRSVWRDEAALWRPDLRVVPMNRSSFRWPNPGEIGITTYESTPERFNSPPKGLILIGDECHRARKETSGITQRLQSMAWAVLAAQGPVWALTGTPVVHTPDDLWTLLGILQAQRLVANGYGEFVSQWGGDVVWKRRKTAWGTTTEDMTALWHQREPSAMATQMLARVAHRVTREQVADQLPQHSVRTIQVPLSKDASKMCDEAIHAIHARGLSLEEAFSLAHVGRLPSFPEVARARAAIALCKAPALIELIEDHEASGEPVIVASAHRAAVDGLGARPGWGTIHGGVSQRRRDDVIEALRAGRLKGVSTTVQSAGVGIDLSAACHMILSDLSWGPGDNDQAVARLHGPRQTRPTTLTVLLSGHPLEQRLRHLVTLKSRSMDGVDRLKYFSPT